MDPDFFSIFKRILLIVVILIIVAAPKLGLLLLLFLSLLPSYLTWAKKQAAIGRAEMAAEERRARAASAKAASYKKQDKRSDPIFWDEDHMYGKDSPTASQYKAKKWHKDLTRFCIGAGIFFVLAGVFKLTDVIEWWGLYGFGDLVSALVQLLGGGGALWMGVRMWRARKLERQLDKIVGTRDSIPLDELFAAAGISYEDGRRAVNQAIEHGYFGADAYIDNRTGILVVRGPAPEPQRETEPDPVSSEDHCAILMRQLREAHDQISDPIMSAKVTRLEEITTKLFAKAQGDEAKQAQLRRFIDYYLPTTIKILNAYVQLPTQDLQGENITSMRQSIERCMDPLIGAYENQLDKLFQADVLDVASELAALESMLNLDGLSGQDFKPASQSQSQS